MKKILLTLVKFALFFAAFFAGSFLAPLHLRQTIGVTHEGTRVFLWDGVVLMVAIAVLVLLAEAVRRRLAASGPWTVLALLLAGAAGYALKLGFLTM
jgi:hypothetical protein